MRARPAVWLVRIAVAAAALALGGLIVAASGVVSIAASSGHWAITEWLLQFGKRRSVATHTLGMEPLDLSAPWLVLKGAGHYENGCRPCHGSPDLPTPRIAATMTPLPPYLPPRVSEWEPEELFWIVKHGIKFTGMPAWRAQERDDEVVALVAFLLAMPELDASEYEELVHGEAPEARAVVPLEDLPEVGEAPEAVIGSCARCHGVRGLGRGNAAFPKLAGQRTAYLFESLQAYAGGKRHSGIMEPVAAGLSTPEQRVLARYYASLPPSGERVAYARLARDSAEDPPVDSAGALVEPVGANRPPVLPPSGGPADAERGRAIASLGDPERNVPSCRDCHGPAPHDHHPAYPRLIGQYADYLVLQLQLFQERRRGGSQLVEIMHHVVDGLDDQQIRDVALYYAGLPVTGDTVR
ncbi:MAG TPA: c-type cytochrome [Longimicrobiales bacterium]|nr:c-type cytochrome [Longimicrobiales bacterium]